MAGTIYGDGFAITPDDNNNLAKVINAIYVGGAGNVTVELTNGSVVTFFAVAVSTILPVQCRKVKATGTTATLLLGLANY